LIRSKMGVIKSKTGTTGSQMGRKFEQKRKAKWVKKKKIWSRPTYNPLIDKSTVLARTILLPIIHHFG